MALAELVDASLLEFSDEYAPLSVIQEPKWRVRALPVDSADRLQTIKRDIAIIDTLACVQIGQKLKEAQAELNMRGKSGSGFQEWVESETPYGKQAAYDMINIANRFGENDVRFVGHHFSQTVLARLAAPSTPEAVIEKAVAKSDSGEKVTVADVKDWKALEAELEAEQQRNREWMDQNKANQDKIKALVAAASRRRLLFIGFSPGQSRPPIAGSHRP